MREFMAGLPRLMSRDPRSIFRREASCLCERHGVMVIGTTIRRVLKMSTTLSSPGGYRSADQSITFQRVGPV